MVGDQSVWDSVELPMVVVCHFPHKTNTQTLKSESSASPFPLFSSASPLHTPPTTIRLAPSSWSRPSLATAWSRWRLKAAGPATDEDSSQGQGSVYGSPRYYDSDGVGGQGPEQHGEDSDAEDHQVPRNTHHKSAQRESQTVSSISSHSQGTASESGRSRSQSGSQPKPRKKHHHSNSLTHPPESPLGNTSHSSRDHRRLQKSRDRMPVSTRNKQRAAGGGRGGTGKAIGMGGSPGSSTNRKKTKGKRKRADDDDDFDLSRAPPALVAQYNALMARIRTGNLDIDPVEEEDEVEVEEEERDAADDDYDPRHKDDDGSEEEEFDYDSHRKLGFNMGDPKDEKSPMWMECYKIMREKVYREIKFINDENLKDELCNLVMDHLGIPQLTLTGQAKRDMGTYRIRLVELPDSCFCPCKSHTAYLSFWKAVKRTRNAFRTLWKQQTCRMLNKTRNYVQGQCFNHVKKLCKEVGVEKFPTVEEVIKVVNRDKLLLPPPEDASADVKAAHERLMFVAVWYVNSFLCQVAGASTWQREAIRKHFTISEAQDEGVACVPVNTEAMAILFFENGMTADPDQKDKDGNPKVGKWPEYFKLTDGCQKKAKVPRSQQEDVDEKHEGRYSSSKAGSSVYGGWSDKGLIRFEHWISEVLRIRDLPHCIAVEEEILRRSRLDIWKLKAPVGQAEEGAAPKKKTKKKSTVKLTLRGR